MWPRKGRPPSLLKGMVLNMPSYKALRRSEDIKRVVSDAMRELNDPRVKDQLEAGRLSLLRTDLAADGSHCKLYISSLDGMEAAKEACKGLSSGAGLLKRHISNALKMKKCPELHFLPDDSIEHSAQINQILADVMGHDLKGVVQNDEDADGSNEEEGR